MAGTLDASCYVRLPGNQVSTKETLFARRVGKDQAYKWQAAVCAPADLWLVGIDEYPRVTQRSPTPIASNDFVMCPADGLLVYQVDRCIWLRLKKKPCISAGAIDRRARYGADE